MTFKIQINLKVAIMLSNNYQKKSSFLELKQYNKILGTEIFI